MTDVVEPTLDSIATPVAQLLELPERLLDPAPTPAPPSVDLTPEAAGTPPPVPARPRPTTRTPVAQVTPAATPDGTPSSDRPARSRDPAAAGSSRAGRPQIPIVTAADVRNVGAGEPKAAARRSPPRPDRLTRIIRLIPGWVKVVLTLGGLGLAVLIAALLVSRRQLTAAVRRAHEDVLTGLPNRAAFEEELGLMTAQSARSGASMAVIMLDLDHFKSINDVHGHKAGDAVLAQMGALARTNVRGGDFVARYGGEEFVLLLPGTDLLGAGRLAENLRGRISATRLGDPPMPITASLGVAAATGDAQALRALVAAADAALYEAKANGRDRVVLAESRVLAPA
ncbi:MAG: diguanylate cyclase [Solirubrobacteraceae bacterium]